MAKILITGGAGFIGAHLCQKLLTQGNEIICLDNFFTGNKNNVAELLSNPNFKLVEHDVEESYNFEVDQIYNLACPAAPIWYQKDPVKTVRTNIMGAINALELAKKIGCRVLQASTSEVYGDPLVHPQNEKYWGNVNPIGRRACYDEGKRCAETLFFDYYREYGIDIKVVRIFNTYGPKMAVEDGRVISSFIVQALQNKDLLVFGEGKQTRSPCFVADTVDGLVAMMASENFVGPVNIGKDDEYTIKELAEKIIQLTDSKSKIVFKPLPEDDPIRRRPDLNLAKEKLNWSPQISLEEGLLKTTEYFKKVL
ncbi:MAG: SDR family oxidoreductase [Patescibacteria group bacterium]|nr:SDR family oxidoreductase [Patescibacteria group bacterium]